MLRKLLLISVTIGGLTATTYAADKVCKPFEKFNRKSESDQIKLLEGGLHSPRTEWTENTLVQFKETMLECAAKRKKKAEKKKAFGAVLGAVGGALASKDGHRSEGAVAGANLSATLFEGTKDKKLLSFKATIERLDDEVALLAQQQEAIALADKNEAEQSAIEKRQVAENNEAQKQAGADGVFVQHMNKLLSYPTLTDVHLGALKISVAKCVSDKHIRTGFPSYEINREGSVATKCIEAAERFGAEYKKRKTAYIKQAEAKHMGTIEGLGINAEILNSSYADVTLRSYLAVLLNDPNVRVFEEAHIIADMVVVVKAKGQKSSKYYFDYDYGDLTPKAIETPYHSGLQLVSTLPDRRFTFATFYFDRYEAQIKSALEF